MTVVMIVDIRTTSEIRDAFYDGFFAELYDSFVRGDINENEAYEILGQLQLENRLCACKLSEEEKFGIVQALMKNKRAFELDMLELDEYE